MLFVPFWQDLGEKHLKSAKCSQQNKASRVFFVPTGSYRAEVAKGLKNSNYGTHTILLISMFPSKAQQFVKAILRDVPDDQEESERKNLFFSFLFLLVYFYLCLNIGFSRKTFRNAKFFLALQLNSVNGISSTFGQKAKRTIYCF